MAKFELSEVKAILEKYVPEEERAGFFAKNQDAIKDLMDGRISPLMEGFVKREDQGESKKKYSAKVELYRKDGFIKIRMYFPKKELNIGDKDGNVTIDGGNIKFSAEDIKALKEDGRLNKLVSNGKDDYFVSVDKDLNSLSFYPAKYFQKPTEIYGTALTEDQQNRLAEGERVPITFNFKKEGTKTLNVHFDASSKRIRMNDIDGNNQTKKVEATQTTANVIKNNKKEEQTASNKKSQAQKM